MSLGNFLGGMAQGMMPVAPQITAMNQQPVPQQMPQPKRSGGFNNFLGFLADTLLINSGRAPVFGPTQQANERKRTMGTALANYLGNSDAALNELFMTDPETGLELYKLKHPAADKDPEMIQLMRIAGIDPTSEQGQSIVTRKLVGEDDDEPTFVRELRALGIDPGSAQAREIFYGRNSPAGYMLKPSGEPEGNMPTFSTPEEAKASGLPAGTKFRAPNGKVYAIPGGATASPSPTFPR